MNRFKKQLGTFIFLIVFTLSSSHVFAEELVKNGDTEGQNNIVSADCTETTIDNQASTENNIVIGADTGQNIVDYSSVVDNFSSGNISGQITAVKDSNSALATGSSINVRTADQDNLIDTSDFTNPEATFAIGSESSNTNQFLDLDSTDTVDIDFNTGENQFDHNTYIENAETGDIAFAANLVNVDNLVNPELLVDINIYSLLGDYVGDVLIEDSFLLQPIPVSVMEDNSTMISNHESVTSNAQFDMNTGDNTLSNNSLVGDVTSGDTDAGYFQNDFAGLLDRANFFILNVLGDWTGQNLLAEYDNVIVNNFGSINSQTQIIDLQENQIESDLTQDTTFSASANTGRNAFNQNTYVGNLSTGNIDLMEMIINLKPNLKSLTNKLNIRVLNILGNWRGNLGRAQASCQGNNCNPLPPTPPISPEPAIEPAADNAGEVKGVSETDYSVADTAANSPDLVLAAASTSINPGNIEAGTNIAYLVYLLPLITILAGIRAYKKA